MPRARPRSTPLSSDELDKITALVQQSLGFDKERGDSVKVVNAPFRVEPPPKVEPIPIHQQPWLLDLLRAAAAPLALALVALVAVFKLIRPALNAAMEPPGAPAAGARLDVVADNDVAAALPAAGSALALGPPAVDNRLESARAFAQQNPAAVAEIVKSWVGGDAPPAAPGAAKPAKA